MYQLLKHDGGLEFNLSVKCNEQVEEAIRESQRIREAIEDLAKVKEAAVLKRARCT